MSFSLQPIDDRCDDCRVSRATLELWAQTAPAAGVAPTRTMVGRYCTKDAPGALRRGGTPKPEKAVKS